MLEEMVDELNSAFEEEINSAKLMSLIEIAFLQNGVEYVEPYETTEGAINRKEVGNHTGLYYIYPEKNFYFGKTGKGGTVIARHKTHRAKLDVDLAGLYNGTHERPEPRWIFPAGWKEAVCEYIIEDCDHIPDHFEKIPHPDGSTKRWYRPGVTNFPVKHKVDVDTLPVLVWNLDHLDYSQISRIEEDVINLIEPYANVETYRKRKRARKNG
jgi:hypothetical protein